jgi:hypothetical protein
MNAATSPGEKEDTESGRTLCDSLSLAPRHKAEETPMTRGHVSCSHDVGSWTARTLFCHSADASSDALSAAEVALRCAAAPLVLAVCALLPSTPRPRTPGTGQRQRLGRDGKRRPRGSQSECGHGSN